MAVCTPDTVTVGNSRALAVSWSAIFSVLFVPVALMLSKELNVELALLVASIIPLIVLLLPGAMLSILVVR